MANQKNVIPLAPAPQLAKPVQQAAAEGPQILAGKPLSYYFSIIKLPLIIIAAVYIFLYLLTLIPILGALIILISSPAIILAVIALFGYAGWSTVKKYNGGFYNGLVTGALLGLVTGIFSVLANIIKEIIHPTLTGMIVNFFSLIFTPIGSAVGGLIIAGIGALIATEGKFE